MYFPQASTYDHMLSGALRSVAQQLVPEGLTKLATVVCTESPTCTDAERLWAREAPGLGLKVVYQAKTSLAQPDFTAQCLAARNAGAEIFHISLDTNSIQRVAASCARQGYRPALGVMISAAQDWMKKDPNLTRWCWVRMSFPTSSRARQRLTSTKKSCGRSARRSHRALAQPPGGSRPSSSRRRPRTYRNHPARIVAAESMGHQERHSGWSHSSRSPSMRTAPRSA